MCAEEHNAIAVCQKPTLGIILDALVTSSNKSRRGRTGKGRSGKSGRKGGSGSGNEGMHLHCNVTQSASMVLENVATFADVERCGLLVQMGVVEEMVKVLGSGTSDAKAAAADALVSLMQVDPDSIKEDAICGTAPRAEACTTSAQRKWRKFVLKVNGCRATSRVSRHGTTLILTVCELRNGSGATPRMPS